MKVRVDRGSATEHHDEFDPDDAMRFHARRQGMIKLGPNEIVADGTDWRFLNELKRELKA
jgi:NitT/TauT family transport system substrate-binding protein